MADEAARAPKREFASAGNELLNFFSANSDSI
jgi:hypothetical protein